MVGKCFLRGVTICGVMWNKVWNGEKSGKGLRGMGDFGKGWWQTGERGLRTSWKEAAGDEGWGHIL